MATATCVRKAISWIRRRAVNGEVIVADNGSTDGSRVVQVSEKNY
jgi:glycosyltransferase involved in cell wall biosynthesis